MTAILKAIHDHPHCDRLTCLCTRLCCLNPATGECRCGICGCRDGRVESGHKREAAVAAADLPAHLRRFRKGALAADAEWAGLTTDASGWSVAELRTHLRDHYLRAASALAKAS